MNFRENRKCKWYMRCNFKQKSNLFDFDAPKEKDVIFNTWQEFQNALANKEFSYDETDR